MMMNFSNSKRILVFDSGHEIESLLILQLEGNYQITRTADINDAATLHCKNPFDLAIVELFLPDNDGFDTILELRRLPAPPKFIVTAEDSLSARTHFKIARHLGAQRILPKPINMDELLAAVRNSFLDVAMEKLTSDERAILHLTQLL